MSLQIGLLVFTTIALAVGLFGKVSTEKYSEPQNWSYAGGFWKALFVFRNPGHKSYFQTMIVLFMAIQWLALLSPAGTAVFRNLTYVYTCNSLLALLSVFILRSKNQVYSIDCIWFNGLLAIFSYLLAYYGKA